MRELSLFTGAGGGLLGSMLLGWEPVQFVEHDRYCQRVLAARFPDVHCHSDVRDFHPVTGSCDIVTGGFPCQPFSQAGKRLGEDDPRNMWPHAIRVLRESGAPLGFFENVPGLLSIDGGRYFGRILGDLSEAGYDAEWCVLGADDVGAPHRRKRMWILAYRDGGRCQQCDTGLGAVPVADSGSPWWVDPADVGDAPSAGAGDDKRRLREVPEQATRGTAAADQWLAEPYVGRVANGVASRVDRLRALGNGQCPQTMAAAFTIMARGAGLLEATR